MLANDVPSREFSHLTINNPPDSAPVDDRLCPGCKQSAVSEHGGLVVAFGQSFFHVDCFKCAKCRNQVTADTNLLLLSDGSPICANCSYSCNICHNPILDEAIMTGDDSYHAHCFKCKVCHNRIDELVFAKTSQGIYCMNCHNERMIKIRKHAQKKAERERAHGTSSSSRSREHDARQFHRENEKPEHPIRSASSPKYERSSDNLRTSSKAGNNTYVSDAFEPSSSNPRPHTTQPPLTVSPPSDAPHPLPHTTSYLYPPSKSNTLPIPPISNDQESRRRSSYDDGTKLKGDAHALQPGLHPQDSLSVTSKRDKRRSINPGLNLPPFSDSQSHPSSPRPNSFSHSHPPNLTLSSQTLAQEHSRPADSRSSSRHGSLQSPYSEHDIYSSYSTQDGDDNTVVMRSPPTMTIEVGNDTEGPQELTASGEGPRRSSATLSPTTTNGFQGQNRHSSTSVRSTERSRSGTPSRSSSPAYRADVPHGIESGTDTEADTDNDNAASSTKDLPALPPKDRRTRSSLSPGSDDHSESSQVGDAVDDTAESQPVEQTSHSTFIAPALPPIRFSMNTADFSELLSSVGGAPSLKSLDNLAKMANGTKAVPNTPPPTASSINDSLSAAQDNSLSQSTPASSESSFTAQVPTSNGRGGGNRAAKPPRISIDSEEAEPQTNGNASSDPIITQLREALTQARGKGAETINVDINVVDAILEVLDARSSDRDQLKRKLNDMNRTSKHYIDGLTVAQAEYDRELKARRDAEAEVTRLRVLLSGQAVRLTALSGDTRRQELRQQLTRELNDNLSGLEQDLSRLKVERDMTVAEMEELSANKSVPAEAQPSQLGRSLTKRLDNIRSQYQRELIPLTQQKEALAREIAELKAVRDVFLEETTVLNARNEELAQLTAVYSRRLETADITNKPIAETPRPSHDNIRPAGSQATLIAPSLSSSTSASSIGYDESLDARLAKPRMDIELQTPAKTKFKWPGYKAKDISSPSQHVEVTKGKAHIEHNFQQLSVLRFPRCDHCGDKMWGSQLRCTVCAISIHVRCIASLTIPCNHQHGSNKDLSLPAAPPPPSMFGRELVEQVRADSRDEDHSVPVIVEKCIEAVEERALDYEGIYRKTGGSGQSKAITQMFERGDYDSFDLCDSDRFNDICSVTSVLKTYFRSLPDPLLTYDLHDQFTSAINIRDTAQRHRTLVELIEKLPREHYYTLRMLMIHLNHVRERSDTNLMNARNLGVVFGPTLMRSRDPAAEFSDMAGKALFIEWLVDNAPLVFDREP